ncbi:MAG TPA: glycosyltransferase family 2 protein [Paraburkholderia sp.]|jgi:glycosyltransferase involved in cell wall biosynthesis
MYPEVSIIVPTYRRLDKLARALASIAPACSLSHQIIVIDDCPEGSAAQVALQYKAQYFCKADQDRGLSQSRNVGLKLATGKYLVFLDDDDFFTPGGVDALHRAISTGASLAFGDYSRLLPNERIRTNLAPITHEHMLVCNEIPIGSYMIERASIRRSFDEGMRSHEDWDFLLFNMNWSHARHAPFEVVVIDKTQNLDNSMQARRRAHFWLDFISVYSKFPAPELAGLRAKMLAYLGVNLDENMLRHSDVI